jgi:hypothetical protein
MSVPISIAHSAGGEGSSHCVALDQILKFT